ncbi:MAG: signal recognition particle receptor subunit alpha, partial [Actinoallomurus sp.]
MEYLYLAIAIVVLAVIGGFVLLRGRTGRRLPPPETTSTEGQGGGTAVLDDDATAVAPSAPAVDVAVPAAPEIELPPPSAGRLVRLRARLSRSQNTLGKSLLALLSRDSLDDDAWDEIEDTLVTADVGVVPARQIVDDLRTKVKVLGSREPDEVRALLKSELLGQLGEDWDRSLRTEPHGAQPAVILVVGVNGTGKTTTCGKLARVLVGDGRTVLLGAADTFRAAAADQLQTWGSRVGAEVVRRDEGTDPASVAFEAVKQGIADSVDAVIVDTAGRLHTKAGL